MGRTGGILVASVVSSTMSIIMDVVMVIFTATLNCMTNSMNDIRFIVVVGEKFPERPPGT